MILLHRPLSPKLLLRIMDCFLSEGIETIFRIALTLLMMGKHELLLLDMEGVIKYFQKEMPKKFDADQEAVFSMAFLIKINQKKMRRLEKEYTTMKSKEKEDEIELRVSAFVAMKVLHSKEKNGSRNLENLIYIAYAGPSFTFFLVKITFFLI